MSFESSALILAWIAIALLAFAMSGLLRQVRALAGVGPNQMRSVGPIIGSPAPPLDGISSEGRPQLLLFVSPHCPGCERTLPELASLANEMSTTRFVVVFPERAELPVGPGIAAVEHQALAFEDYRVPVTPFAVLVDEHGIVSRAEPVGSSLALRRFVAAATREGDDY